MHQRPFLKEIETLRDVPVRITYFFTEGITRGPKRRNRQVVTLASSHESLLDFFFFLSSLYPRHPRDDPDIKDDSNSAAQNIT